MAADTAGSSTAVTLVTHLENTQMYYVGKKTLIMTTIETDLDWRKEFYLDEGGVWHAGFLHAVAVSLRQHQRDVPGRRTRSVLRTVHHLPCGRITGRHL